MSWFGADDGGKQKREAEQDEDLEPRAPPELADDAHKGDAGRILAIVGSRWMPGAAALVAKAALRSGAGLVTIGALDAELAVVVASSVPEAIFVDLSRVQGFEPKPLAEAVRGSGTDVLVVGSGLGADARTRALVHGLMASGLDLPLVLDADALNVLSGEPERLKSWRGALVLTPHPGEAERLLGRPIPRDPAGRLESARALAQRSGAIVCLKGAGTVVTDGRRSFVNDSGNPGMATAGAGDVLSGILGAYLVRAGQRSDWSALDAAVAAVHVHGLAGDECASAQPKRSILATDLIAALGEAQSTLGCE